MVCTNLGIDTELRYIYIHTHIIKAHRHLLIAFKMRFKKRFLKDPYKQALGILFTSYVVAKKKA